MCPENLKDLKIRRILIIGLSNLGDNILLTPAIARIRETFKDAGIDIAVGLKSVEFAKDNPWFSGYLVFDGWRSIFRFLRNANKTRYDLIIDFRNGFLSFLLRGKYKMGFCLREFFSEKKYTHESKRMLDFIAPYFGKDTDARLHFQVSKKDRERIEERLRSMGIKNSDICVVLTPGTDTHAANWVKEKHAALAKELFKTYVDIKIFITGTASEKSACEDIRKLANGSGIYNLAGETTLKELGALLEKADLLITDDSGTMHMAAAVNCPVAAIFGPVNPYRYGPVGTKNIIVHSKLECFPCKNAKKCRRNFLCLEKVSVDQVMKAAMLILDEKEQPLLFDL